MIEGTLLDRWMALISQTLAPDLWLKASSTHGVRLTVFPPLHFFFSRRS